MDSRSYKTGLRYWIAILDCDTRVFVHPVRKNDPALLNALEGLFGNHLAREILTTDGRHESVIPQLKLYRFPHPTEPLQVLHKAAAYVVAQGRKQATVGW